MVVTAGSTGAEGGVSGGGVMVAVVTVVVLAAMFGCLAVPALRLAAAR